MMAGFGACQEIRLEISCSGSRSKLHLEPYGAQSVPKPCFGKVWFPPRSHAMQAILDFAGQKNHVLRGRLPPAVFFQEKCNPQILDMPTRPNFQRSLIIFNKKGPTCSAATFFRGNFGLDPKSVVRSNPCALGVVQFRFFPVVHRGAKQNQVKR